MSRSGRTHLVGTNAGTDDSTGNNECRSTTKDSPLQEAFSWTATGTTRALTCGFVLHVRNLVPSVPTTAATPLLPYGIRSGFGALLP